MEAGTNYLSQTVASTLIDPSNPPGIPTLRRWHDRIGAPRDVYGRRIWTAAICDQIRSARQANQAAA